MLQTFKTVVWEWGRGSEYIRHQEGQKSMPFALGRSDKYIFFSFSHRKYFLKYFKQDQLIQDANEFILIGHRLGPG